MSNGKLIIGAPVGPVAGSFGVDMHLLFKLNQPFYLTMKVDTQSENFNCKRVILDAGNATIDSIVNSEVRFKFPSGYAEISYGTAWDYDSIIKKAEKTASDAVSNVNSAVNSIKF